MSDISNMFDEMSFEFLYLSVCFSVGSDYGLRE